MMNLTLFGLALAPLYAAIAKVESNRGATSTNVYQLRQIYVADVNRIRKSIYPTRFPYAWVETASPRISEQMMYVYWQHWGRHYEEKTRKPVTYEVLARIHNGGPLGWKKPSTVVYWNRVAAVLATQTQADIDAWMKGGKR